MSEDKKKIVIVHSAAPYEDTKKAVGWIIVIALVVIVAIVYAIVQGVIFLAKIVLAVIIWIGLAIWFLIKWITYPVWAPVYYFDIYNWWVALILTVLLILAYYTLFSSIKMLRKSSERVNKNFGIFFLICAILLIGVLLIGSRIEPYIGPLAPRAGKSQLKKIAKTIESVETYKKLTPEEEELEAKVVKANYILESFLCDVDWNKRYVFSQDKVIYMEIKFDSSKGYIYNRDYPVDLMFYLLHENDNKPEDDPYAPKTPISAKKGFVCKNDHSDFWGDFSFKTDYRKDEITFVTDYKYIILSKEPKSNVRWCIKGKDDYMESGEWKIYLFMIRPDYIEKKIPSFVDRRTEIWMGLKDIRDLFKHNEVFCQEIKSFLSDELVVKLTFKIF